MIPRPMKPQWFQILLALSEGALHGYGIQRAVLDRTDRQMTLWPATLYRSLSTLQDEGMIAPADAPAEEPEDARRDYWTLTTAGRARLREEADLLARWAEAARSATS